MNTVLGPGGAIESFLERLAEKGPRAARPAQFVDTLLSMPASRVGIALGLRGSTAVLGGSSALELALDWVRSGREGAVVAGGAELLSPKCVHYLSALAARSGADRAPLSQGAAFMVVEDADAALERGAKPVAELLGAGAASDPQLVALPWPSASACEAFARAMRDALTDAGVGRGAVTAVALAAGDDLSEREELAALGEVFGEAAGGLKLIRPKRLLGEALGASASLGLPVALASAEDPATVLVNSFEMGGAVTSLLVRVA
jgi:3-oxoacyl-[acyl-carrier-protein] synthase II